MGKGRQETAEAGGSALAEWGRARRSAHRRLPASAGLTLVAGGMAVLAGWRWDTRLAGAASVAAVAAWCLRPDSDVDRWRRGAEAEAETAAILGRLRRRWVVLHDRAVPGSRANIDHLVIGPTGVWVVDTKSARAPLRIRRGAVWAGERPIDTAPAAWEAEVVSDRLGVDAVAIVAVHGEGLRRRGKVSGGVRVVSASRLVPRLRRGRRVLTKAEVAHLADRAARVLPPR